MLTSPGCRKAQKLDLLEIPGTVASRRRSSVPCGMLQEKVIGRPVPRKEGFDKVTGRAQYVDDLTFPGMIHGVTVRSEIPRGKIVRIEYAPGIPWNEFIIATATDIP